MQNADDADCHIITREERNAKHTICDCCHLGGCSRIPTHNIQYCTPRHNIKRLSANIIPRDDYALMTVMMTSSAHPSVDRLCDGNQNELVGANGRRSHLRQQHPGKRLGSLFGVGLCAILIRLKKRYGTLDWPRSTGAKQNKILCA